MNNDDFEWDPVKAGINSRKHKVDFDEAQLVFEDPNLWIDFDFGTDITEDRFQATGMGESRLITVIYTERGNRIRIISARKANSNEQREYHRGSSAP